MSGKAGMGSNMGKLVNIQILRAIAATLVVVDHAIIFRRSSSPGSTQLGWQLGNVGVWTFFIISGFIMYYSEGENFGSVKSSMRVAWKRLARILPLYWIATLVAVALSLAATMRGHSAPLHSIVSVRNVVLSAVFVPYVASGEEPLHPIFGPGWTLEYEMIFYFIFGLSMTLWKPLGAKILLSTLIGIVAAGTFLHPLSEKSDAHSVSTFLSDPILLLFVVGIALAAVKTKSQSLVSANCLPLVLLFLGLPVAIFYYEDSHYPLSSFGKLAFAVPCAFAVLICLFTKPLGGVTGKFCTLLGDASYATYLSNLFVVVAISKFVSTFGLNLSLWSYLSVSVCLANAVGVALHIALERPLLKILGRPVWLFGSNARPHQSVSYPAVVG